MIYIYIFFPLDISLFNRLIFSIHIFINPYLLHILTSYVGPSFSRVAEAFKPIQLNILKLISSTNKYSDRSIEVLSSADLGNNDRPSNQPTEQQTDRLTNGQKCS